MRHGLICIALSLGLSLGSLPQKALAQEFEAERAFAGLLFGRYYADPCANTSGNAISCAPRFAERRMEFADDKARQTYHFEENRCIVNAETVIAATGQRYSAKFNLQNVLYINLSKSQQEGNLMEIELFLQGAHVLETDGKTRNVLVFIHKYFATGDGDIGHEVKREALDMRKALKDYQNRFCGALG